MKDDVAYAVVSPSGKYLTIHGGWSSDLDASMTETYMFQADALDEANDRSYRAKREGYTVVPVRHILERAV